MNTHTPGTTLEITTVVGCRNACTFCPQSVLSNAYKGPRTIPVDAFKNWMNKVPQNVVIDFSGFSEPLFHPLCAWLMDIASQSGHEIRLYTTLMGASAETFHALQPKFTRIHVPDDTAMVLPDEAWIRQHDLFDSAGLKADSYMSMGTLTTKVRDYLQQRKIDVEIPTMLSRGGALWVTQKIEVPLECAMNRWHNNVLMPNGDVYLCCMDYGLSCKLGSLSTEDYEAIYTRAEALSQNHTPPDDSICRTCEWAKPI